MKDTDDTYDEEDNETIENTEIGHNFSLFSVGYIKLIFLMFLLFLFINSEVFTDKVLSNIEGTIDHDTPTSKGVFIQAILYTMGFVAIDSFVRF